MEFLVAEKGRLYLTVPRKKRVGQIILQHGEGGAEPLAINNAPLDRDGLINMLLIGREDFNRLVKRGKVWPLLNLPLYSKSYYNGVPFENVRKKPIDFDFIQIQSRALIYADGDRVRLIGSIDGLSAFLLVKIGLVISPETVVLAIDYANKNGLSIPDVNNPLVKFYTLLKKTHPDVGITGIKKDGKTYVIETDIGKVYFDGKRLATSKKAFSVIKKLPVEEGYIEEEADGGYTLHSFVLKEGTTVNFEVNPDGTLTLTLPFDERVTLDALVSLKDGVIVSAERQRVNFRPEYKHLHVNRFFKEDRLKALSTVEVNGERLKVVEDAEAMEMTDVLRLDGGTGIPFGEVVSRSKLLSSLNFTGESLKYALFTMGNRNFILTYGSGGSGLKGVLDRSKQHFLINDGLTTRVYRIVRLDRFEGPFKVEGPVEAVDDYARLVELNFVSKVYPLPIKVELGDDVFITARSPFGEFTFHYSREAFRRLEAVLKLGGVRFSITGLQLPTDKEGVRVYSVTFEQRDFVGWVVGLGGEPGQRLRNRYVFWKGSFSYLKRKIRPLGVPEDFRPSGEICLKDLYGNTVCIPVSGQTTLF